MPGRRAPYGVPPKQMEYTREDAEEFGEDGQPPRDYYTSTDNSDQEEETFTNTSKTSRHSSDRHLNHQSDSQSSSNGAKNHRPSSHSTTSEGSSRGVLSQSSARQRQNFRIERAQQEMAPSTRGGRAKNTGKTAAKSSNERIIEDLRAQKENQDNPKPPKWNRGGNFVAKIPLSQDLKDRISIAAGTKGPHLWRTTKFLGSEEDLFAATKQIMTDIPDCRKYLEGEDKDVVSNNILAFKSTYGSAICKAINDSRSNAQTGLKNAYMERFFGVDKSELQTKMPDPNQLMTVLMREELVLPKKPKEPKRDQYLQEEEYLSQKNKYETKMDKYGRVLQNREWFKWYWNCLLPKVCGNKRWGQSIRHYGIISEHAPMNDTKKYVTSADEALVLLLYENSGQRFPYIAELNKDGKSGKGKLSDGEKQHEKYQSAYTNARVGQIKWGGWDEAGRARFSDILHEIARVKRKHRDTVKAIELSILKEIQRDLGFDSAKDKKRKAEPNPDFGDSKKRIPVCIDSDQFESEDEGGVPTKLTPFAAKYQPPKPASRKKDAKTKNNVEECSDDDGESD